MTILQINSVYNFGSTGKIVSDLHKILQAKGKDSYIAYGRGEKCDENNIVKIGSDLDTYFHVLGTRLLDRHGLYSKRATKGFIKEIEKINFDIVHLHNIHGYYLHYPILFEYLEKLNKPVVWTLHDCWSFTGHCSHYDFIGCQKWQDVCCECPQIKEYPKSLFIDNARDNYLLKKKYFTNIKNLTIVTPSYWLKNEVKKSFLQNYNTLVINNGINLDVFNIRKSDFRKKYKLENKFLILGVASVWENKKGFEYFLALAEKLLDDECIVLVGLNKKQLKGLPKNVLGIERTSNQEELAEIYSSADIFVNLTLEEVLGLTNIESLACGTPIVTFNSGGSPECIDENTGIVVEKENLSALYDAISIIKKNGKITYETACRERAKNNFDKDECFNKYITLYDILNEKVTMD
jgi:glycosyltransferase involved in cell wall biosynthesis